MDHTAPAPSPGPDVDDSRVYFGPFSSPEKKYLAPGPAAATTPFAPSPLRRSPRLSSPIPEAPGQVVDDEYADENAEEEDEDELSGSRSGTPDNDGWQRDEPSSVLASRITRAHDNPSPPPVFHSAPPSPGLYPPHPIPFIISDPPSPRSKGGSPFPVLPHQQPDLISFDSFSTSVDPLSTHPIASTSFILPETHNPSVDELLTSWSPSARDIPAPSVSPPPSEGGNAKGKGKASPEPTQEAAEEEAIAEALISPDAMDRAASAPPPQVSATNADPQPSASDAPQTPLRRSTRPRRSGTPHAHLVPLPSSDDESPANLSPFTRKRRSKGKERATSPARETSTSQSADMDNPNDTVVPDDDSEAKKRRERKQGKASGSLLQRQLGSLSPGSANLLTQLLPSSSSSRPSPVDEQEESTFSFSVFPAATMTPTTPIRMSSPVRASPERRAKPRSPTRITFQAPSLNDPNRTPARRIPVEEAVARGQISPQKGAQLLSNHLDPGVIPRTPIFHIPPQDSPARRVNVIPPSAGQDKWQGMRFGSPTRGKSRERSGSVEPRPPWNGSSTTGGLSDLGASGSKSHSSPSRSTSAPIKKGKLPFPLTPSGSDRPLPIPEVDDKLLSPSPEAPAASPVLGIIKIPRSNLKQPTSRIPRIGTKPYARPGAKSAAKPTSEKSEKGKAPAAKARKLVETARQPPSKTIKVVRTASGSSSDEMKMAEAGPSNLKRKRVPSPQHKTVPVVLLRQVAPTKYAAKPVPAQPPSPVKRPTVAKFRMVDLHARPVESSVKSPESGIPAPVQPTAATDPTPVSLEILRSPPPSAPAITSEDVLMSDPAPLPPSSPLPEVPESASVRRTTRLRKSVFAAPAGTAQPLPIRRKVSAQQQPSGTGVFAGMTAVALKALTLSNTTKNQNYLAAKLETEVVRKEGARPESPAVKIKTVAQREQDEKGTQRKARAARRARRSDDGFSDNEAMSDDVDSSPLRHRRGAGEEEDYETPRAKRPRSGSMSGDDGLGENKKRVKWDRGLSTTVFLDEVEPRTKARPKENMLMKGCLAPTAKALRLDPLGNHPNAESPLKDLVEENIVVKKFVYDNDEPILPVIVVKNTRSRAKKKS